MSSWTSYKSSYKLFFPLKTFLVDVLLGAPYNTALKYRCEVKDRSLATYIMTMAQLIEGVDDPERALLFCKGNLEEMHRTKTIIANFNTEVIKRRIKYLLKRCKRREIIWLVCHVNRLVFDVTLLVGREMVFRELFVWPTTEIQSERNGKEEIDVLCDFQITRGSG